MNSKASLIQSLNKEKFAQKGEQIYREIEDQWMATHLGEVVAIEVESGNYFIGRTHSEDGDKAKRKFPEKIFYFARVGARAAVSFR